MSATQYGFHMKESSKGR